MLSTFIGEYLWVTSALFIFALMGGFILVPFLKTLKYPYFAAPFAGLLMMALGCSGFYSILNVSLFTCVILTFVTCSALTLLTLYFSDQKLPKLDSMLSGIILVVTGYITYSTDYTTISLGKIGFLFMDGSDHLGYAQLADWLSSHVVSQHTVSNAQFPYQAWPNVMFHVDPRFGSFFLLGALSLFHYHSGIFSYDIGCTLILCASYMALAAIFSRSRLVFFLLLISLATSSWFDLSRAGYFGKIISYPAVLFVMGLFFNLKKPITLAAIVSLAIIVCAIACSYPGVPVASILALLGITYLSVESISIFLNKKEKFILRDNFISLSLLILIAVATSGTLSKPTIDIRAYPIEWIKLFPRFFHLVFFEPAYNYSSLNETTILIFSILTLFCLFYLFIVSLKKRDTIALSLLISPIIFIALLMYFNQKWIAYESIGLIYPIFLCGSLRLIDSIKLSEYSNTRFFYYASTFLVIFMICLHLPRFIGVIHHFASKDIQSGHQYTKEDFDRLQQLIGKSKVTIDIPKEQYGIFKGNQSVMYTLPLLVELGKRDVPMQFSSASWLTVLSYTGFPPPALDLTSHLFIKIIDEKITDKHCTVKYKTAQYQLVDCSQFEHKLI